MLAQVLEHLPHALHALAVAVAEALLHERLSVLPVVQVESGSSIRRQARISKAGRSSVRQKLYMAAVTACQYNPVIRALKRRMQAKGKAGMAIVVAAMRKLVHIAFGVLKHQQGYVPQAA